MAINRHDIVTTARGWKGTPFRHQGRQKSIGCDCIGLIVGVAHELGLSTYDFRAYGRLPRLNLLEEKLAEHLLQINLSDVRPGDVLSMTWVRYASHVAIVTDAGIIHSYRQAGGVVEHGLDQVWQNRISKAWRFPESVS